MNSSFFSRFRVLPLLVLVAMAAFAVRVGDTVSGVRNLASSAIAEELATLKAAPKEAGAAPDAKADAKLDTAKPADGAPADSKLGAAPAADTIKKPNISLPDSTLPEVWADPTQQQMSDSPEQMRLLDDLAKRRQMMDQREKALDTREALLSATQKQIEDKMSEMTELKDQIEKLLGQQESQETDRIKSLVKIYEGMKPKEAAAIFNQMDMSVLLQVISKMSERKSAPIIAAMDTAKANELTVRLTEMQKLPDQIPDTQSGASQGPAPTSAPRGSASLPGLDALGKQ